MKIHTARTSILILICCCLLGCDSKQSSSVGAAKQTWKLATGTEFSCWATSDAQGSWIWSDLQQGSISYRIIGGGHSPDWVALTRIKVSNDSRGKRTITPDPTGKFGATEALHRGRYMIQFKVGDQEFSELTLDVE